jgi:hypothetical protein
MQSELVLIDPLNFKGSIISTVRNGRVDYTNRGNGNLLLEDYLRERKITSFELITWEVFTQKYSDPFLLSLQGAWKEISEEKYWYLLDCLPPKRWKDLSERVNLFFVGECYTATLYTACIHDKATDRFYSALWSICTIGDDLIGKTIAEINHTSDNLCVNIHLNEGIYFVHVFIGKHEFIRKMIVQKAR